MRTRLQRLGVLRESGHEHFNGSLVIPVLDGEGRVTEMYGRKVTRGLRQGTPDHPYLPGPHRGVWNLDGVCDGDGEVILCEALIDALTFWAAGTTTSPRAMAWRASPTTTWQSSPRPASSAW